MTLAITEKPNGNGLSKRDPWKDKLIQAIPSHVDAERFLAISVAVMASPELKGCTEKSLLMCIYGCAKLGLIPDPVLGHIYIIPFRMNKGKPNEVKIATLVPGYKGLCELARRSKRIGAINTGVVYEGEEFTYYVDENGKHLRHIPDLDIDPSEAKPIAVYCIAEMLNARPQVEVMRAKEIGKINTNTDVWNKHPDEMARKTVVRRASKMWPLSPELAKAVALDEQFDRGEFQQLDEFDPPPAPQAPQRKRIESLVDDDAGENGNSDSGNDGPPEYDPSSEIPSNDPEPPARQEPAPQVEKTAPPPLTYEQFELRAIDFAISNNLSESNLRAGIRKWVVGIAKKGKENTISQQGIKLAWEDLLARRGHFSGLA